MKVKVNLYTYLVTDDGMATMVPFDHKLATDELRAERQKHESVFYVGVRTFTATVDTDSVAVHDTAGFTLHQVKFLRPRYRGRHGQ